MKTVHMIGNAHLDPVWLWRHADASDIALATARSACDRLDEYPEFVFTASASWFHETIERLDPDLFERARKYVASGRWQLVGGMLIQPDCNLPSEEAFARQLTVGQEYFRRAFGRAATVGYNVDSFGHVAYLPRFLRAAGIDSYVFMRPKSHEKSLPANLFRWRSPDGHDVLAFRISGAYASHSVDQVDFIHMALEAAPEGVDHTMVFYGVGDHGGGPTRKQIEWIMAHRDDFPGARLVLSHPRAYFDAVAPAAARLAVVEGELQHHAVGCYAVERRIKVAMRRAEARLVQAEQAADVLAAAARPDQRGTIDRAWKAVLFNQFHDILGGTCIPESSARVAAELGAAEADADQLITDLTRRALRREAKPGEHRVVVFNPSAEPFDDFLSHESFGQSLPLVLLDERGRAVPHQAIEPRAKVGDIPRLLFRLAVAPRSWRILRMIKAGAAGADSANEPQPIASQVAPPAERSEGGPAIAWEPGTDTARAAGWTVSLDVVDDPTDTWAHTAGDRFAGAVLGRMAWDGRWEQVESGPIRRAVRGRAAFGQSRVWLRAMATAGQQTLHLRLAVVWAETQRILRLRLAAPDRLDRRLDLVSGGPLVRALDGHEYPLGGAMVVAGGGAAMGVTAPEVFSVSADPDGISLTLVRSPFAAHHDPFPAAERPDGYVTDQGLHEFDLVLWPGCPMDRAGPAGLCRRMLMPPVTWDLTG